LVKKNGLKKILLYLSSSWISSGIVLTSLTLIVLPLLVVTSFVLYDDMSRKYSDYGGWDYERVVFLYSRIILQITYIIILFIYPPYPAPYSSEKYFRARGFETAVVEYEYVKKILYIAIPILIFSTIIPFIATAITALGPPIGYISSLNSTPVLKGLLYYAQLYSFLIVIAGLFKIIIAIARKKFRLFFARGCFKIMQRQEDEVQKMGYFIKGLNSYNSYLRRHLNIQIKDIKKIYSIIISAPVHDKNEVVGNISQAFIYNRLEDDTLLPVRYLYKILNAPETEQFLTEQSAVNKIKEWSAIAAVLIPLVISIITFLVEKFLSK
jgi:hypothetical protein